MLTFLEADLLLVLDGVLQYDLQQLLNVAQEDFGRGKRDGWRWPREIALVEIQFGIQIRWRRR